MGNQVLRQRWADRAEAERVAAVRYAIASHDESVRCEAVLERAKSFAVGSASELGSIEAELKSCGLTLAHVQR